MRIGKKHYPDKDGGHHKREGSVEMIVSLFEEHREPLNCDTHLS